MQRLVDTYKNMQQHNKAFKVREPLKFSFGKIEECKTLLLDALQLVDRTAKIEWLPEYEEVAAWMCDNKGKGLLLSGDCGRGKSNIVMFAIASLTAATNLELATTKNAVTKANILLRFFLDNSTSPPPPVAGTTVSVPKSFVFSRIAKTKVNINKNGNRTSYTPILSRNWIPVAKGDV